MTQLTKTWEPLYKAQGLLRETLLGQGRKSMSSQGLLKGTLRWEPLHNRVLFERPCWDKQEN